MLYSIGRAARLVGVAVSTLRRWDTEGKLRPAFRTPGGHRRYHINDLLRVKGYAVDDRLTIAYARVSSHDQKHDLARQAERLEQHCTRYGQQTLLIRDLGSGLNYGKPGFRKLLSLISAGKVARLVLMHKDRLLRFGSEIIFQLCAFFGTEVVVVEDSQTSSEESLARDVIELMTVFSARLHGRRSHLNRKRALGACRFA